MRQKVDLLSLLAELDADMELLGKLERKNRRALECVQNAGGDELDRSALGYTLKNIKNLLENYFLRIAKFFENALNLLSRQKDLVQRMALPIEGIRPARYPGGAPEGSRIFQGEAARGSRQARRLTAAYSIITLCPHAKL
jgi:hypothetical protein